jgi:tRNA U34 2-thiouridine synthase MnmA/TrmU
MKKKTVFVGISGGVDSAVSAAILKKQGYEVVGVFIRTWHPDFLECNEEEERFDAMRVAAHLDIPFLTFDLADVYKKEVADYMISEYREGRTPNPDVMCNKEVKFGAFLKKAISMGADYVATGHYAQNFSVENFGKKDSLMFFSQSGRGSGPRETEDLIKNKISEFFIKIVNINWISKIPQENKDYTAQIRYHGEFLNCRVEYEGPEQSRRVRIILKKPVLVASGQSCVIYDKDVCLGGGVVS